jgi:hypothetical protein
MSPEYRIFYGWAQGLICTVLMDGSLGLHESWSSVGRVRAGPEIL